MANFSLIIDVQVTAEDWDKANDILNELKQLIITNRSDVTSVDTFNVEELD